MAYFISKQNAKSAANIILEDAKREGDAIKEKKILQAKEEEDENSLKPPYSHRRKFRKAQASESRARYKEQQPNQQQGEDSRRKEETRFREGNTRRTRAALEQRSQKAELQLMPARAQEEPKESPVCLQEEAGEKPRVSADEVKNQLPQAYIKLTSADDAKLTGIKRV